MTPDPTPVNETPEPDGLRHVTVWVCQRCLDGEAGECHTPGCIQWLRGDDERIDFEHRYDDTDAVRLVRQDKARDDAEEWAVVDDELFRAMYAAGHPAGDALGPMVVPLEDAVSIARKYLAAKDIAHADNFDYEEHGR